MGVTQGVRKHIKNLFPIDIKPKTLNITKLNSTFTRAKTTLYRMIIRVSTCTQFHPSTCYHEMDEDPFTGFYPCEITPWYI